MFVRISNTPRDYAWGSSTAIAELLGWPASGGPEAELWLGAHPGSPSVIEDPEQVGGARDLVEWIAADPATTLGGDDVPATGADAGASRRSAGAPRLPFLLKILAAAAPLSLQAHPSPERAAAGFARENALGIPLDASDRNYKDAFHKPELIYALSETFDALCGFRAVDEAVQIVDVIAGSGTAGAADGASEPLADFRARLVAASARQEDALPGVVGWLLGRGAGVDELVSAVVDRARWSYDDRATPALSEDPSASSGTEATGAFARELDTVRTLAEAYPGDPGIVLSLLLNRVTLKRGEALYLPAGNIHAYMSGLGVELMAASDNVLRGGLTPKHVDVPELLDALEFAPLPVPYLRPEKPASGLEVFRPDVPDFLLARVEVGAGTPDVGEGAGAASVELTIAGPAIAICIEGGVDVTGRHGQARTTRGQSVYVTPDEANLCFRGHGVVFVATTTASTTASTTGNE